jgi:hypothetical protein
MTAVIDRMDDWINPIVVKELRQAVKSRLVVTILMVFLGLQLFLVGVFLLFGEMREDNVNWNAGNEVFRWQQGILLWTLMFFVPGYAAIRLGSERSDHNVDLLFISTLHPRSIIAGKFFAALVLAMLVYSTCAPFMTFTYLMRGIDIPTILSVLFIDLLLMLFSTMVALFLSSVPGPRAIKFFLGFLGFIGMGILAIMMTAMTYAIIVGEIPVFNEMFDFWMAMSATVAGILGIVGMFYVYSVALISPPSSNRILPVRLYLVGLWLVMGVALFLTSYYYRGSTHLGPIMFWVFGGTVLVCVQFWISICERDRWGPRMRKSIPQSLWARVPAFLFYTGSAGGIALTALLALATFYSAWWWCDYVRSNTSGSSGPGSLTRGYEEATGMLRVMVVLSLYTWCYGLSAVLVRTHVLAGQLKASFTWLVALLLLGLGSSIPYIIAMIFFSDQLRYQSDGWWMLPNPFVAVYEFSAGSGPRWGDNSEFQSMCYWFLGTWGLLVAVLAVPSFIAQVRRFRPREKRDIEFAPVMLVETAPSSVGAG